MSAARISVEWMVHVPQLREGGSDYDHAEWAFKLFGFDELAKARKWAQAKANSNAFGQVWLNVERADSDTPHEWEWDRDHDASEILEAE